MFLFPEHESCLNVQGLQDPRREIERHRDDYDRSRTEAGAILASCSIINR